MRLASLLERFVAYQEVSRLWCRKSCELLPLAFALDAPHLDSDLGALNSGRLLHVWNTPQTI